jgi:hypothetical protein
MSDQCVVKVDHFNMNFRSLFDHLVEQTKWALNCLWVNWSLNQVFIPTFWLVQVLNINVVTWLEYSISILWLNSILILSRVRIWVLDLTRQAIENSEFNEKKYWLLLVEVSRAESASSEFMRILTTTNRDFSSMIHR